MASVRKLPSGKYQATVRLPGGKRTTRTDPLKRVVVDWARDEETRIARGEWRDQRSGRVFYDEWRDKWLAARVVEPETSRRDRWVIPMHLDPQWAGWRLHAVTRLEVQGWVKRMQAADVGPHAIRHAYNLFATMMNAAVDEGVLPATPCRRIDLPATPPKLPEWFTHEQVAAIAERLPARHAAAVWLMAWCGLRWGEMAGLRIGNIAFLRRRLSVVGVNTQNGRWKEYPKSSKSRREISVPPHVLEMLAPLVADRPAEDLIFRTERGERPWSGANWRVVWNRAIDEARGDGIDVPRYTPHALRHTAASTLVQNGVPLYDVQALLGHESPQITARYSHLRPDAHGAVEAAWVKLAPHQTRTEPQTGP